MPSGGTECKRPWSGLFYGPVRKLRAGRIPMPYRQSDRPDDTPVGHCDPPVKTVPRILHILPSEPDATVEKWVERISGEGGITVTSLYRDHVSEIPVDWLRLVDDIFSHDRVICWW